MEAKEQAEAAELSVRQTQNKGKKAQEFHGKKGTPHKQDYTVRFVFDTVDIYHNPLAPHPLTSFYTFFLGEDNITWDLHKVSVSGRFLLDKLLNLQIFSHGWVMHKDGTLVDKTLRLRHESAIFG